jgi:hypothetical protein
MFTRKVVLMIALGLTCGSALAEWTAGGWNGDHTYAYYVDNASIHRKGNIVKMWHLYDFKSPKASLSVKGKFYLSSKGQNEYDCSDERVRLLAFSHHTKHMGAGDIVFSNYSVIDDFEPVAPDSIYMGLLNIACGKQ